MWAARGVTLPLSPPDGYRQRETFGDYLDLCASRTLLAMNATTFDTLAAMRRLEQAGIDAAQAEAIIDTMRESAGEISTKNDIERLDSRLNTLQWVVGIQSEITLATFGIVAAKLL